ncbi:MAG TPA: trehalose-phosphatase [Thermoanaerobaculia bacterium]|nr:trehalose-phosphatase [Thermoanaerobaculia bacterium]
MRAGSTAGSTLLAFDFDGTLAPICDDPALVRLDRGASALLAETTQMEGVVVAIVSGRDADDLSHRVNAPGAYLIASHGLEIRAPGGVLVRDAPRLSFVFDRELEREIAASGLRIESKKHAVALHWRGIPYEAIAPVVDMFRAWAKAAPLELIEGRCVVEARTAGAGKEEALRWLSRAVGAARVVYAGDDLTDFGPLRFAAERGRGLFVASDERIPPPGVTVVGSFRELFRVIREEVMI